MDRRDSGRAKMSGGQSCLRSPFVSRAAEILAKLDVPGVLAASTIAGEVHESMHVERVLL